MKKFLICILLIFAFVSCVHAADVPQTTGFIPGQIWYSQEPLVEGDKVLIYTAIWNGDDQPLSARVEFYDKNVVLGTRDVTVSAHTLKDVSVSWQVTAGDHLISAKIISSSSTNGTKKETVVLDRNSTGTDKKFVPVVVKSVDGTPASSADVVRSQVDKATTKIADIVPDPIVDSFSSLDTFRSDVDTKIETEKEKTQKKIDSYKAPEVKGTKATAQTTKPLDSTEKPIAYIKLFLLSVVGFIFGTKLIFYGLVVLLIYFIVRTLYRKVRNR